MKEREKGRRERLEYAKMGRIGRGREKEREVCRMKGREVKERYRNVKRRIVDKKNTETSYCQGRNQANETRR